MRVLILALVLMLPLAALADTPPRQITVVGQGMVSLAPDQALLNLGVISEGDTGAETMAANNQTMRNVLAELNAAGISTADLQTHDLSLTPRWNTTSSSRNANGSQIAEFTARNLLSVRVRDLDSLGVVLDASVSSGANMFNGLTFSLSDPGLATDRARRAAVTDALAKAALYAEAAGVTLGDILSINEVRQGQIGQMLRMEMRSADAVPIAAGEVTVAATVTLVFAIAD